VTKTLLVVVAVLGLCGILVHGQSKNDLQSLIGTWKLNVEKSKFDPGPGPKSQTLTWKASGSGFDFTVNAVNAQGQTTQTQTASGNFDGTPYPYKTATATGLRTSKWIDGSTIEEIDSVDGKVRTSRRAVLSKDGKVLTVTASGVNAQGQKVNNLIVYEKQ
jgi:hypothetical protein